MSLEANMRRALGASPEGQARGRIGAVLSPGLAIGWALCTIACSTSSGPPPIAPEEPRDTPAASAPPPVAPPAASSATASSATGEPTPPASATSEPAAPKPMHPANFGPAQASAPPPAIGTPCKAGEPSCGNAGRVAVVSQTFRTPNAPRPCNGPQTSSPTEMMNVSYACVDGDRIVVWRTCMVCRIPTEDRMIGLIAEMTPEQLAAAQKLAGLPERPLLTKTAQWNMAIADASRRGHVR